MTIRKEAFIAIPALLLVFSAAEAGKSERKAIEACKSAIIDAEGNTIDDANLKKIKPRGRSYELWFNVSAGEREMKSFCEIKRGEIQFLVTSDGRWSGSNPKRPEA